VSHKGHYGISGVKISYRTEAAALSAVASRQADGVRHDGRDWGALWAYGCRECKQWHLTSGRVSQKPRSPGFEGNWLMDDIELGGRVLQHLHRENRASPIVSGIAAAKRMRIDDDV
jgi:hypothetical protein